MKKILIGKQLRALRKEKGFTLKELSRLSGVQEATLCRIENDKMPGTLRSHASIAYILGVELQELYKRVETVQPKLSISPSPSHDQIFQFTPKVNYKILVENTSVKKMLPTLITMKSGGSFTLQDVLNIEKFLYVLQGKIDISIEGKKYSLKTEDCIYFNAALRHDIKNTGNKTAKIMCVNNQVKEQIL